VGSKVTKLLSGLISLPACSPRVENKKAVVYFTRSDLFWCHSKRILYKKPNTFHFFYFEGELNEEKTKTQFNNRLETNRKNRESSFLIYIKPNWKERTDIKCTSSLRFTNAFYCRFCSLYLPYLISHNHSL
jgi:hypothetical protein